ncbi:unnamed protein product [Brassicogethes aeneus]|uniref:Uncharacterized protein n=1 Tax=Brassicogethes aeneus TaxID=1431903 RepID=A0A9P0B7D9_BRAAE|nr:unnamed protein product [Brassicogethes aeneus]
MQLSKRACVKLLFTLLVIIIDTHHAVSADQNFSLLLENVNNFKKCLGDKYPIMCFKERALDVLNETIMSDAPITFIDGLIIERNPEYIPDTIEEQNLPSEASARSSKLSNILHEMIEDFFKSRTLKVNLAPQFEGRDIEHSYEDSDCNDNENDKKSRKKGGGGGKGKGGMMMMGMIGMGCMMAQMMMGKVAFMAGAALIIAKIALILATMGGMKKMSGGGGSDTHVVWAAPAGGDGHSHGGGGGGGGGWHRSIDAADNSRLAYSAQITENQFSGYK